MAGPRTLEILISEDGSEVQIIGHNFQGTECQQVAQNLQLGEVLEMKPTAEFQQQAAQTKKLIQGR